MNELFTTNFIRLNLPIPALEEVYKKVKMTQLKKRKRLKVMLLSLKPLQNLHFPTKRIGMTPAQRSLSCHSRGQINKCRWKFSSVLPTNLTKFAQVYPSINSRLKLLHYLDSATEMCHLQRSKLSLAATRRQLLLKRNVYISQSRTAQKCQRQPVAFI